MLVGLLMFVAATAPSSDNAQLQQAMTTYFRCMDNAGAALEPSGEPAELVGKSAKFQCIRELHEVVEISKADFISDSPTRELIEKHGDAAIAPWIKTITTKIENWGVERAVASVIETRAKRLRR